MSDIQCAKECGNDVDYPLCDACGAVELERLRAENARLLADRSQLWEVLARHCNGKVEVPCAFCGDSTYDHYCNDRTEPCPYCATYASTDASTWLRERERAVAEKVWRACMPPADVRELMSVNNQTLEQVMDADLDALLGGGE